AQSGGSQLSSCLGLSVYSLGMMLFLSLSLSPTLFVTLTHTLFHSFTHTLSVSLSFVLSCHYCFTDLIQLGGKWQMSVSQWLLPSLLP
uniref:Uncharacterized protein n=1 Tax=Electrophorus electricus TaxID=8005 RepID=A0A4W4H7N1_ELEEL